MKLMVSDSKGVQPLSKINPCGVCGKMKKSHHKFYVVCEVQKVDPWTMH